MSEDGGFSYAPEPNYHGQDSFTYAIEDRDGDTAEATVLLTIDSKEDVPTPVLDRYTLNEDQTLQISAAMAADICRVWSSLRV